MADNARAKKLADLIREVVAQKLQRGIKDPRLGSHVTITDTRVTGDLREATVFYTVYGDDEERAAAAAGLESAKGVLRSAVGAAAGVKFTPTLTFVRGRPAGQRQDHRGPPRQGAGLRREGARGRPRAPQYAGEADPYRKPGEDDDDGRGDAAE